MKSSTIIYEIKTTEWNLEENVAKSWEMFDTVWREFTESAENMCGVCAVRNVGPIYWENTSEAVSFKKLQVNVKPGAEPNGSLKTGFAAHNS